MQITYNPFEEIYSSLRTINEKVDAINSGKAPQPIEIIDRTELQKRLGITEPTAITWGKRGKIPELRIGSNVRYNWPAVVQALESKNCIVA